jgi:ankyrin repeat protein
LQWLAFSNRPLTIKELAEAAVIDTAQEPAFEEENRFEDPSDILRILSSLVTVQNERRGVYNEEDDFTSSLIVLGHFSIKEYLTSNRLPTSVQRFAMGHDICHRYLTKSCLLYNAHFLALLAQEDVQFKAIERGHLAYSMLTHNSNCIPGRAPRYKLPCDHNRFPLLEYSRIEWTRHIQEWALDTDPECNNLIFRALTSPSWNTLWDVWKGTTLLSTEKIMLSPGSGCPLLVAVYFDLYEVCSMMLAAGKDPNTDVLFTPENESWTLLEAAVNNGNEKIVKLLIDAGGEVNYRRSRRSNLRTLEVHSCLLHMAVRSGKTYLVQLLIDSGINAGSCDDKEYTYFHGRYRKVSPLETAASQRKWDIFRIIFDHGRDVDLNNALEIASCMGEWEIFDDLIDSKDGVDVNYAASIAAENHNCQAVEHLLKRGADVHELHRLAVEWDDNELVEFLLKERQEYTPDTGDYDRLLHTAMAWGNNNPAVVKLLLEHGANANASGGWAGSALQQVAALDRGFHLKKMELLKLLLEYGANPNIQRTGKEASSMTSGRTPLQIILLEGLNFSFSLVSHPFISLRSCATVTQLFQSVMEDTLTCKRSQCLN